MNKHEPIIRETYTELDRQDIIDWNGAVPPPKFSAWTIMIDVILILPFSLITWYIHTIDIFPLNCHITADHRVI